MRQLGRKALIGVLALTAAMLVGYFAIPVIALHLGMGLMFMGVIR